MSALKVRILLQYVISMQWETLNLLIATPSQNSLWLQYMENNIWLTARHLPGKLNVEADQFSRHFNDKTEWHLKPEIFPRITDILGFPDIDLFALRLNHQH